MENEKQKSKDTKNHHESEDATPDAIKDKTVLLSESEYAQLLQEANKAKEYWDRILRLQADFENNRKRMERERQDFVKFANEGIVLELLNILDDIERTVELAQSKHQDLSAFLKGVEMILAHLYELLKSHGVKPIDAKGKVFDPHFHEALMQAEDNTVAEHTIVEELQKGYLLNDRIVRTAKVKVSKHKAQEQKESG